MLMIQTIISNKYIRHLNVEVNLLYPNTLTTLRHHIVPLISIINLPYGNSTEFLVIIFKFS